MTVVSTKQNVNTVQTTQPVNTVCLLQCLSASVTRSHCCGDCSHSTLWQITLLAFLEQINTLQLRIINVAYLNYNAYNLNVFHITVVEMKRVLL